MRRRSPSAATESKKAPACPAITASSMRRSSPATRSRKAGVFGSASPKRGPTCARSTPAMTQTLRSVACSVSPRASRKRGTRGSDSGSPSPQIASWRKEASTGRMENDRSPRSRRSITAWNSTEGIHLARVGAAGMGRRPAGTRQPVAFDPALAKGEAGAVQEARLVEALDDLRDVLGPRRLVAAPARQDVTHLGHGVLAVEEGDEIQKGNGEQRDLIGEAAGIPEPDQALAVLLHGKVLERAQSGPLHAFFHREPTARDTSELMPRKSLPPRRVPVPRRIRRPDAGSAGCRGRT